ncbi:MAG: hypothetical protein F9K29_04370 [Hyphomicrobiaceae bacterium]|nr:MAG: hypothetical protein F9K29_04370 [Hyphomicrobiaceae bacterium]
MPARQRSAIILAFALTMAVAGFLLFQVQLVLAKYILPWFGGSASTWLVCLLFFQVALLAGYAYAYAVSRPLSLRRQVVLQFAVVAVSLLLLPITPSESWKPQDAGDPTWRIVALLAISVGGPYAVLATTTPLLSRWLAGIDPALDPARLFAASNLGSFLGLLTFPFAFERFISSEAQTRWWSWSYVLYGILLAACGAITLARTRADARADAGTPFLQARTSDALAAWITLPALGSVLLLATTNAILQWSAVLPFLWVVPLSIYLLTYVIAFGHQRAYDRLPFGAAFLLLAGTSFLVASVPASSRGFLGLLTLHAAILFAGCMICHCELARLQPEPARLPKFYLAITLGGALGGIGVALIAPLLLSDYFEHWLVLGAVAIAAVVLMVREGQARRMRTIAPVAGVAGIFFVGGLAVGIRDEIAPESVLVERIRNFYGVVKVLRQEKDSLDRHILMMQQAGIEQGGQFQGAGRSMALLCGFDDRSALGLALRNHAKRRTGAQNAPLRIGIIGLGAGTIAAHGREGDVIRYYELNPAVLDLAKRHFTFLRSAKATTDVLLGDGRLVLERQLKTGEAQNFDVLVINAFRGASPPMHLMTAEAFEIYLGHLAGDGILAVNFEVDTFEMAPLHRGLAQRFGVEVRWFETREVKGCDSPISWALYTQDKAFFAMPAVRRAISPWRDDGRSEIVWTDNDSNLVSILNWGE